MEKFEWTQNLAVGIPLVDEQHKMIFQRANEVARAIDEGQALKEVVKTLGFLIEYTHYHFSTEEKHMKINGYPELDSHQASHRELIKTLADLERDFTDEGATFQLAAALKTFLINWLTRHIQGIDVRFGNFLNERGIEIEE